MSDAPLLLRRTDDGHASLTLAATALVRSLDAGPRDGPRSPAGLTRNWEAAA